MRTLLTGELGVTDAIAELTIGHVQGGVKGIYDRARYVEPKSQALQRMADFVARITEPPADNVVVPLRPVQTFDRPSNVDGVAETAEKSWSSNPSGAVNNLP
jgi:hypothetical protein